MSNSTSYYWDVDGTSLQTYAYNITTLGGGRDGVPPLRGSNRQLAYRPGAQHRAKVVDSRTLTLAMWVIGAQTDGTPPAPGTRAYDQFVTNWRMLKRLFWKDEGEQIQITKRWPEGGSMKSATALAEIAGTMEPEMQGDAAAAFVVDLLLADPYFYASAVTTTLTSGAGASSIDNVGDAKAMGYGMSLVFHGPLTNPKLTNTTPNPDIWVKVGSTIAGGVSVTLDVDLFTATRSSDSANLIGSVTHSGSHQWMRLLRGTNSLALTSDAGAGTVDVIFKPAYV